MFFIVKRKFQQNKKGSILTLVLVFGSVFGLIFGGLAGFVYMQYKQGKEKVAYSQALAIAEAGLNYARWHLAHAANDYDFSDTYDYVDPESGVVGQYELQIGGDGECSAMVTITSIGWSNSYPDVKRTAIVKYGRPSLAKYAFLTNTDIWIGENEEVQGPMHSNGGIRMDGVQNALFTSATTTYRCLPMHGCSSPNQIKPGIWGSGEGGDAGLWNFPVPSVDFNAITLDLGTLKAKAISSGYYFGPSGAYGYRISFNNNGTFDLYRVTKLRANVNGMDTAGVWHNESNDIGTGNSETFIGNYPLAEEGACTGRSLIFVEDLKVWVDGTLSRKATVAAAQFPDNPTTNSTIIINGNISRADPRETMLALIAQKNILVPRYSSNILEIQAVMVAQKGAVQRYYYPGNILNRISVRGSIITNNVWTWTWTNSAGDAISGYETTESYYEPALIYNPPPYFPSSGEFNFISWDEQQ